MKDPTESNVFEATEVSFVPNEAYSDSIYGAVATLDLYDSVEAYCVFDNGDLDGVPGVLDAHCDHHQRQWL